MRPPLLMRTFATGLALLAAALPATADDDRYGFYRVVQGSADVVTDEGRDAAQENAPLLSGDRLRTGGGSRVEVVLPDGTLVRVGGDTEVTFDQLARSGDSDSGGTLLYLERGELQLVTDDTAGVSAYPRVDTPNATVYIEGAGTYRVEAGGDVSGVAVRRGYAELVTQRGSTPVDEGQEAWAEGSARAAVQRGGAQTELERWAVVLDTDYRRAQVAPEVDRSLAYSSSRLNDYGSWVSVESRRGWRPRVGSDWSPYRHGRWTYTPSGLTWVSYEPWGWVPYHYGSWDFAPGYGWVWYPGRSYAPAWVYWYWGPSHVGWVPIGYYYRHYGPRYYGGYGWGWDRGFQFGVHGWAGGRIGYWDRWNFVDCRYFGDRRLSHYTRYAHQLGVGELPRGVIATDTRPIRTAIATRPSGAMQALAGHPTRAQGRDLPDVTRFIARDPAAPADAVRRALPVEPVVGGVAGRGGDGAGATRGAVGRSPNGDASSPRVITGGPVTGRPRGDRGVGSAPAAPSGDDGSDARPQARPRSGEPVGGGDGGGRAVPPASSRPGGDDGSTGRAPADRGGVRATPSRPDSGAPTAGAPAGRGGLTARPSSPSRTPPPADRDGGVGAARPYTGARTAPPQVRPSDDGGAPGRVSASSPRATPRAYDPPPTAGSGTPGAVSRPRALPTDDDRRGPSRGDDGAVSRTPPPSRSSGDTSAPRAVPPVRRVVEGVRGGRSGDTYTAPPSSRRTVAPPPSAGSSPRYTPPARPSTTRGGYATPPPSASAPARPAPGRPTVAPPSSGPSRPSAPAASGRSTGSDRRGSSSSSSSGSSSSSRGDDGGGGGRGRARATRGDGG